MKNSMRGVEIVPRLIRPNQRAWKGGKTLDGGVWLEFQGTPRFNMTPAQAMEMAQGILLCLGHQLERVPTPEELSG
jgi:hypothetical protein